MPAKENIQDDLRKLEDEIAELEARKIADSDIFNRETERLNGELLRKRQVFDGMNRLEKVEIPDYPTFLEFYDLRRWYVSEGGNKMLTIVLGHNISPHFKSIIRDVVMNDQAETYLLIQYQPQRGPEQLA